MHSEKIKRFVTIAAIALMAVQPVLAEPRKSHKNGRMVPLEQSVSRAKQQYNGRVISAETHETASGPRHKIRILMPNGHVKRLNLDARTGRPID